MAKTTPLAHVHEKLGATMTDFGGWQMPLKYDSELAEHKAVREAAGLFDLSHMGQVTVTGTGAEAYLNYAFVGNFSPMKDGKAKYTLMTNADGGAVDDLIIYRLAENDYLVIPNAGNTDAVLAELASRKESFEAANPEAGEVTVTNVGPERAIMALQGPNAAKVFQDLGIDTDSLVFYSCAPAVLKTASGDQDILLARTGYTGEDGFELYCPAGDAEKVWDAIISAGEADGLLPAGLAARDTLRLEAGLHLYGNELNTDVDPYTAGLGGIVSFKKENDFVGKEKLAGLKETGGTGKKLVGLVAEGRRAARAGYPIQHNGEVVGQVTSGALSPTLGHPIAMAYVDSDAGDVDTDLDVDIRGKLHTYRVVELPFYQRDKKGN